MDSHKKFELEGRQNDLDDSDLRIDQIWADEAERRLEAYRKGKLDGIPMDEIFKSESTS